MQLAKFTREAEDVRTASLRAAGIRRHYLPAIDLMPSVGLILVLGVGGHLVAQGSLSIGGLVAFNAYVALLVWPLRTIGMTVSWAQRAAAALERSTSALDGAHRHRPAHPKALPARSAAQRTGGVRFADVRFGYDHAHPVLDGFDLRRGHRRRPERRCGHRPPPGCARRHGARERHRRGPGEGDGGADHRCRRLRLHDLRSAVGIVFEDTLLFHDTVAANIAFADPDASFERIQRAAALAGATEFVHDLPHGYDTLLGERGFSLSGGQRQRIAIARAILADPRVLVLDDATSAIDPSKEHEIRGRAATVMAERSTIVIAHRPATIALAERVVLLDRGRVEAVGTHQELLAEASATARSCGVGASGAERDAAVATGAMATG